MTRSLWKGPYIHPHIFKLNYQLSDIFEKTLTNKNTLGTGTDSSKKNTLKNSSTTTGNTQPSSSKKSSKKLHNIKIWARNSIILPNFIGTRVQIYNGKRFIPIKILPEMVGFKFGSFSATRKFTKKFSSKKR